MVPLAFSDFLFTSTHLTFLWPSDEDAGPEAKAGFRFLGRPGPRLAGLRGVSSFLLANTGGKAHEGSEGRSSRESRTRPDSLMVVLPLQLG